MANEGQEREYIVRWIKRLERESSVLEDDFEGVEAEIRRMVMDFVQTHDIEEGEAQGEWRKRIGQSEIRELRRAIEDLKSEVLSDHAEEEAERVRVPNRPNYLDYLTIYSGVKIIGVMNRTEKHIEGIFEDTVREEFEKQATYINLDRQYIENHLDDAVRRGVYQGNWKEHIWGKQQKDLHDDVSSLIRRSLVDGENPKKIAKELSKRFGVAKNRADVLMITEQASVQAESQLESYRAQEVPMYDFVVEPDGCDECKAIEADNPHMIENAKRGFSIQPIHPRCRCSTVGVID